MIAPVAAADPGSGTVPTEWEDRATMSQRPVLPTGRAAVFAAVCVCLAWAAHRWMSGAPVPPWAVLVGAVAAFGTARPIAGRERSLATITALMAVDQTALHLLFEAAQRGAAQSAALPAMAGMTGMPMPGMQAPGTAMHMTAGMFAAHAIAALVCAWWLRRGEAATHAAVRAVAAWLAERLSVPMPGACAVVSGPRRRRSRDVGVDRPRGLLIRFTVARRGPPRALFA
jgi:hypothetical protein